MVREQRSGIVSVLLVVGAFILMTMAAPESQTSFRVLVTNDDGVESPGIQALAEAIRAVADEVVVVAPDGNRSGSSHATSSGTPLTVRSVRDGDRSLGYGVSGFPADAVRFGILELGGDRGFDLVVSGINRGANVGTVSHLSGTVGAAMEAIYQGVPAVAVSLEAGATDYSLAAGFTARLVETLRRQGVPAGVVLSVNVPAGVADEIAGVIAVPMGGSYLGTAYERQDGPGDPSGVYRAIRQRRSGFDVGTDSHAYEQGFITVTPLRFDWTDEAMIATLNDWELTVR